MPLKKFLPDLPFLPLRAFLDMSGESLSWCKNRISFQKSSLSWSTAVKPNMVNVLSVAVVLHFFGQALSDPSVSNLVRYSKKTENTVTIFLNHPFFSRSLNLRLILPDI